MCGIAGYYGEGAALKALFITLHQLERGTKGSGVAYVRGRKIKYVKAPRHPMEFYVKNKERLAVPTRVAIAHNRLPSVGDVKCTNTHPFVDCEKRFALVHNGHAFVQALRAKIIANGHRVRGDTDSEVLCHRLEELYLEEGDMVTALMRLAREEFTGAVLVLTREGRIYGLRDHSHPMIVAQGKRYVAIASTRRAALSVAGDDAFIYEPRPYQVLEVRKGDTYLHGRGEQPRHTHSRVDWGLELLRQFRSLNWVY